MLQTGEATIVQDIDDDPDYLAQAVDRAQLPDETVSYIALPLVDDGKVLGLLGVHRMYMGKWPTGILYLLTVGLAGLGYLYDYWTLNTQLSMLNRAQRV